VKHPTKSWICVFVLVVTLLNIAAQSNQEERDKAERLAKHANLYQRHDLAGRPYTEVKPNANGEIDLSTTTITDYASDQDRN
jgi:Tfp pilus assembly protein PilE